MIDLNEDFDIYVFVRFFEHTPCYISMQKYREVVEIFGN
jgi:hypothetical protein